MGVGRSGHGIWDTRRPSPSRELTRQPAKQSRLILECASGRPSTAYYSLRHHSLACKAREQRDLVLTVRLPRSSSQQLLSIVSDCVIVSMPFVLRSRRKLSAE